MLRKILSSIRKVALSEQGNRRRPERADPETRRLRKQIVVSHFTETHHPFARATRFRRQSSLAFWRPFPCRHCPSRTDPPPRSRLGRVRRQQGRVGRLGKMIIPGQRFTETLLLQDRKSTRL